MAANIDNQYGNQLLNIQYNMTENRILGEEELSDHEREVCETAATHWRVYLADKVSVFQAASDTTEIFYSNYKFDDWFREGKDEIIHSFAEIGIPENIWEPLRIKIPKIGKEIYKFTELFGKLNFYLSKATLFRTLNGLQMTPYGTVDYVRTATFLIENTDLKHKYKYALACYFCMEEKILEFHGEVLGEYGHRFIYNESDRLMVFWTYHFDNKDQEFNEQLKRRLSISGATNEHLLYWAIRNENQVAVNFIWENLGDNVLKEDIIDFVRCSLGHDSTNIMCYLISQIRDDDILEALCIEDGHTILSNLLFNSRWRNCFKNAAKYVRKFVRNMAFLNAIKTVIVFWLENEPDSEPNRALLNELSVKFHFDINIDFVFYNTENYLTMLLFMEDENIMKVLLNVGNTDELKSLFNRNEIIIPMGKELADNNMLYMFETFVRNVLVGEEIEAFKRKFLELGKHRILE